MILALAVCWASLPYPQVPSALTLSRGSELPGKSLRYWAVEDTVLDSKEPDKNFGGALFLETGPGRPILIRFADLNRAIGPNKRVVKAAIVLTVGGGSTPLLKGASRVLAGWDEGPILALAPMALQGAAQAANQDLAAWSATWRLRHAGFGASAWQVPGALGPADSAPIEDAKGAAGGPSTLKIEGLAAVVQAQLDRPLDNNGFLLQFDAATQFFSSQSASGRPSLELELESVAPKQGADLSVVQLAQSPSFERFAKPEVASAEQDGVNVPIPISISNLNAQHWPKDGDNVTYTAHIRNVGTAPVSGFAVRWTVGERSGAAIDVSKTLAPGEETTVTTTASFRLFPNDHRLAPVRVSIEQKAPDTCPENDSLEIQSNALCLKAVVAKSVADAFSRAAQGRCLGGACLEDWLQGHLAFLNEVAFPQSRFSFAKNGVLERVRLQSVTVVPDGTFAQEALKAQEDLAFDGAWLFGPGSPADPNDLSVEALRGIGSALGLIRNFCAYGYPGKDNPWLVSPDAGSTPELSARDLFPGIMGYGDTRNEAMATPQAALPYGPFLDPMFSFIQIEHTDLFSATDAAALNGQTGKRRGLPPAWLYKSPGLVFLAAKDFSGAPVANAELSFFQLAGGKVDLGKPAFTAKTDASGIAILPKRPTGVSEESTIPGGAVLKATALGRVSPDGANGMFAVKASVGALTEFAFLKAWQVLDTVSRNPAGPTILQLRFNLGDQPVDRTTELAKGRIVTDVAQSLPAQLAPLLDGNPETAAALSAAKDPAQNPWFEIDLGRDRTIAEIELLTKGAPFWDAFDVTVYATGQTSDEALVIAREMNWAWSAANRSQTVPGSQARTVAYRFRTCRARFLRFTSRSSAAAASLTEIRVHPPKGP